MPNARSQIPGLADLQRSCKVFCMAMAARGAMISVAAERARWRQSANSVLCAQPSPSRMQSAPITLRRAPARSCRRTRAPISSSLTSQQTTGALSVTLQPLSNHHILPISPLGSHPDAPRHTAEVSLTRSLSSASSCTSHTAGGLSRLLLALRRTAPRAPIVFVGWSRRGKLSISEQIVSAAHQHAAEVIDLAGLVQRLDEARVLASGGPPSGMAARGGSEARRTVQTLYAQGGRDFVHPSPLGHAVIAAATARHIAMRLRAGLCASAASRTEPRHVGARRGVDAAARPSVAGIGGGRAIDGASAQDDVEGFDESVGSWEQCWTALVLGRFPVAGASLRPSRGLARRGSGGALLPYRRGREWTTAHRRVSRRWDLPRGGWGRRSRWGRCPGRQAWVQRHWSRNSATSSAHAPGKERFGSTATAASAPLCAL